MSQKPIDYTTRHVVRTVLANYEFADKQAHRDFEQFVNNHIEWTNNRFETQYGVEVETFVRQEYQKRPNIHPRPESAGASTDVRRDGVITTGIDIHSINAYSTPEQLEEYRKALVSCLPGQGRR